MRNNLINAAGPHPRGLPGAFIHARSLLVRALSSARKLAADGGAPCSLRSRRVRTVFFSTLLAAALVAVLVVTAPSIEAQTVDLVENELEGVRRGFFRLGPVYVTPSFQISTGYDSNALSTPVAESDVTARLGPGIRLAVPLGSAGFVDVYQEVDYVYYREQIDLRRWFDVTRVGAGFGGRRFLFKVTDEFRDETGRPTSEFDFPVEQRSNQLEGSLALSLGWRHLLRFGYGRSLFEIQEGLDDATIAARLNRDQDRAFLDFGRKLTAKTSTVAEGFFETFRFDDTSRDADSYGARFGFEFSPSGGNPLTATELPFAGSFLNGRFLLGFRSVAPLDPERVDYTGLIGSVDVTFGFGDGQRLQALYSRDIQPSIFDDNWYFVENRWGAAFTYQITERFSVTPGFSIGQNRYPLPAETEDGEEEIFDDHRTCRLAFDVRVTERWTVGVASDYLQRESNVEEFTKDRLQVGLTMSFRP